MSLGGGLLTFRGCGSTHVGSRFCSHELPFKVGKYTWDSFCSRGKSATLWKFGEKGSHVVQPQR